MRDNIETTLRNLFFRGLQTMPLTTAIALFSAPSL
jgi:hypothetical protein